MPNKNLASIVFCLQNCKLYFSVCDTARPLKEEALIKSNNQRGELGVTFTGGNSVKCTASTELID